MKSIVNYISLLSCVLLISCGNRAELTNVDPSEVETINTEEPSNNSDGKVTITTTSGADPSMADPTQDGVESPAATTEGIEWLDFETAIDRNQLEKKFIFIDMYTDWCGWCKKMDASTFKQPAVVDFMKENFYAVKMNPEAKEAIAYKEVLYESKQYNGKAYNELAVNLLAGKMSFPSFVVLNKREVKRGVIVGYQTETQLISALKRYLD